MTLPAPLREPAYRALLVAVAVLAGLALPLHGSSLTGAEAELAEKGKHYLKTGELELALEVFAHGQRQARTQEARADFAFYRGRAYQALAEEHPQRRVPYLKRAAKTYSEYLRQKPDSGAGLNNLARVYQGLERWDEAERHYRRAIRLGDGREAYYRKNYAAFLDRRGDWDRATTQYIRLLSGPARNPALHRKMIDRFLEQEEVSDSAATYLWRTLESGQPRQAALGALEILDAGKTGSAALRRRLLTVVVAALARHPYDPARFAATDIGEGLWRLRTVGGISRGIEELLWLHLGERLEPDHYSWWSSELGDEDFRRDPEEGIWPVDGFRKLALALGNGYRSRKRPERAEAYYRLAADLEPEVDPRAVEQLVKLHVEADRLDRVAAVSDEYSDRLFNDKTRAYGERESKKEEILEYHLTLGQIYSTLGQWGSSRDPQSATFQIERALQLSRELVEENPERIRKTAWEVPAILVDSLARNLRDQGKIERSYGVRLEAVELYQKQGDEEAATEVLAPVRSDEPPPEVQTETRNKFHSVLQAYPATRQPKALDSSRPSAPKSTARGSVRTVEVPQDLRCRTVDEIEELLEALALVPVFKGTGAVVVKVPAAGTKVPAGSEIPLTLGSRRRCS